MVHITVPSHYVDIRPVDYDEQAQLLDRWMKELEMMEDQFQAGENIEIASVRLDQWQEILEGQRNIINQYRKAMAEYPAENPGHKN